MITDWLEGSWQQLQHWFWASNSFSDYLLATGLVFSLTIIFRLVKGMIAWRVQKWAKQTSADFDDLIVNLVKKVRFNFLFILSLALAAQMLVVPPLVMATAEAVVLIIITVQVIFWLQMIADYLVEKRLNNQEDDPTQVLASKTVLQNFGSIMKYSFWVVGLLLILSNLGFDVTSLLAGLGVGGIAIAFALQNILSDLFSSLAIYFDKPFQVGDFIVVGEYSGTVEKIGIKSTRVRALSGEEVIIPNRELTNARVQNYKTMERRRVVLTFGVGYETANKKLEKIPSALEEMIGDMENVTFNRAHLKSFSDSSLDYEVVFHIEQGEYKLYMDVQQELLLELKAYLEKEKITIPYPTQTVLVQR